MLSAICDIADSFGCTIQTLLETLSDYELRVRAVNRLLQRGITFDREKIAKQELEAFQREARSVLW